MKWPKLLQVDPGQEFMGAVTRAMESHGTNIRRGIPEVHRDQAIVERFNRHLAEQLFGHQYAVEMRLPAGQRARMWVKRLPRVVAALNGRVTRLTEQKSVHAIKKPTVYAQASTALYRRPVGEAEKTFPPDVEVRYLLSPGELEGGTRRATDLNWSLETFRLARAMIKPRQPVLYWLRDGPKRSFVHEEVMVVPPNTELPPTNPS